nr:lymphokine-activated killer T-cell-originated protein kinase-like isoform X1 [Cherax quadricarinatus]
MFAQGSDIIKMAEFRTPISKKIISLQNNPDTGTPRILIPPSPYMKQLGYGTGVNVYLMERFSPVQGCYKSPWAVKKPNRRVKDEDEKYVKRLNYEADILKSLKHQNIIGYRSYSYQKDGTQCLVMESGEKSLADIIESRQVDELGPLPSSQILKVAWDVCSALVYLHEEKHLLHGDLKSPNILIKGNFEIAKLCDFGVTLKLDDKGMVSTEDYSGGTVCWSAPEALLGDTMTDKTDMFSFGLVLWEMLSLNPPHLDKISHSSTLTDDLTTIKDDESEEELYQEFYKAVGTRPSLPNVKLSSDYIPVLELFYSCTEAEPARRPSAKQVLHVLECLKDKDEGNNENL